ncbi:unnamed protein product (macronuclear) [Paramecium tetraurelia]|uniref:Uncharacterized protein n=1 Tax=Paramecium tetraurelia TaxID=5888 RepID=A0EGX0_PARTE|nr:uncharacterized protein GSPATT00026885001 [Paramecium tetraurelia]CAK94561.1 unnamed protein product [Paramecium tetraurelia]|eukprot:XP_001461934.1 hypothetical protein (macronuclear) [Paramecium tetraurelia strain d4-2]
MSQISNDSNTQFYSPKSSTNQDQFKSAQDKTFTPYDERSITPKSNTNSNIYNPKDQTPIVNADFIAQFGPAPQQELQQSKIQFYGFDDFPQMGENINNEEKGVEFDSSYEYEKLKAQQQLENRKQSRDMKDIEDLFNKTNSQNAFSSSEQFYKFNSQGIQNYGNTEKQPLDIFKMTENQPEKQNFPQFNEFSSTHQKTQQMAFTFHEVNQFLNEGTQNNVITDSLYSQSFAPKANFEVAENNFSQFQLQQLDYNQNLNFHKANSTPVQQNIFEQPKVVPSQQSLSDEMPGSNISSQIRNQTASQPQLNYGQQISPQSNSYYFLQQQQQPEQTTNYSPIQSLEIIKQIQQFDLSSEREKKFQQNDYVINSKLQTKEDDSEIPWQDFNPLQQSHDNQIQDNIFKMKDQEVNLPQDIIKQSQFANEPKASNLAPIQVWQEFIPQSDPQSSNQLKKPENPLQQQDIFQIQAQNQQQYEQQQQKQQSYKFIESDNQQFEDEEFQPNFPVHMEPFQDNQNLPFKEQNPNTQIPIENLNGLIQSHEIQSNESNHNGDLPYLKQLQTDQSLKHENNRIMSHNSFKSFQESQQNFEEEIYYDFDDFDQTIETQNFNQKQQQNQYKISSQQLVDQQQELKITPRNEGNKQTKSVNENSQPNATPNQSPPFQSITNSSKSANDKKKNNPFDEVENNELPKWDKDFPQFDYSQFEAKPELKKQLESITEMQEESLTQSQAIQNRNSTQFQENTLTEFQEKSIEESKVIQPSIKVQSQEIPTSFKGFHGVRESKDSNKEPLNPQLLAEQLIPGLQDIIKKSFQSNIQSQLQLLTQQFQQKLQDDELDNFDIDKINSKVFMIENLVQGYGKKLDQITEMLNREKEMQEQQRISEQKAQHYGQDSQQHIQHQKQKQICSPLDLDLEDHFEEQPIQNVQHQNQGYSKVKIAQSNLLYNTQQKGFVPYQTLYQTQSQYFSESRMKDAQVDNIQKYQTNYQFQKQSLKGLQDYEIQNFKKQCLSDHITLLDTYELIVTLKSEKYDSMDAQGYKVIIILKNKAQYEIQNLIVLFNSNKIKDEYTLRSEKVSQQYLNPGEIIRQEITFQHYDLQSVYLNCYIKYTINNLKMGYNFNKMSQSQGLQGTQDYSNLYLSQMNSRYAVQDLGQFKRNFQFCIARPANKFFVYNFITSEELQDCEMKCQSEQFQLRSLEELVIFHPWLIQIDQFSVGGKVFVQLKNGGHEFMIKVVNKNQKGIVFMNGMNMDLKQTEHFLTFFAFLFSKLY